MAELLKVVLIPNQHLFNEYLVCESKTHKTTLNSGLKKITQSNIEQPKGTLI